MRDRPATRSAEVDAARFARKWRMKDVACILIGLYGLLVSSRSAHAEPHSTAGVRNFEELRAYAFSLSQHPFVPPAAVPDVLSKMTYDDLRLIAWENNRSIWLEEKLPFRLEAFHKGFVHKDDVRLNLIYNGVTTPLPFLQKYFQYRGKLQNIQLPNDIGFAGLRVVGQYPTRTDFQEMLTFLGASYFRGRGAQHVYGAAARGLAVDVGTLHAEEFPLFREFWIVQPEPRSTELRVLALLDSPSVAGGYEFVLHPGVDKTDLDVASVLFFRRTPEKVAFTPLTSMWMWGDGLPGPQGDHRPEVHDSDGLLIEADNGEWTWRALGRQTYPSVMRFEFDAIRGYGLLQRDLNPDHYQDDEAKYNLRPSLWIEPKQPFGPGAVELLELPAPHEGIDNVAAYWIPKEPVRTGEPVELKYTVSFFTGDRPNHGSGKAVAMRVKRDGKRSMEVEVDFQNPPLPAGSSPPAVRVQTVRGEVTSSGCDKNPNGIWTARVRIAPTGEGPVELTVFLAAADGGQCTETWKSLCPLEPPPVSLPPWRQAELAKEPSR